MAGNDWRNKGFIALHVDDDLGLSIGIDLGQRLEDPVGSGLVIGPCHHHLEARRLDRVEHLLIVDGRNLYNPQQAADAGLHYLSIGLPYRVPEALRA